MRLHLKSKIASNFSHQNSEIKYQLVSGDQGLILLIQLDALGRIAKYGLIKNHENSHFLTSEFNSVVKIVDNLLIIFDTVLA